jgi:hypothetical protein
MPADTAARAKQEGRAALAALDRALQSKPEKDGHAFSEMTGHLCAMRDVLIAQHREDGGFKQDLGRLNAVISTSLAGHFPLGNIPWSEVEHARGALEALLAELE